MTLAPRRLEDFLPLSALFTAREWIEFRLRHPGRRAEFEDISAGRRRNRLFLIGNGPSLRELDLDLLANDDYMLVNMAEHLDWARGREHPYYLAADTGVPEKYPAGCPDLRARHYFYAEKLRDWLDPEFAATAPIFWFTPAKGGVLKRGLSERPWISVASGQTILVTGAQLGWALGYRAIYVLGCDLDYGGPDPYAYRSTEIELERARRNDDKMRVRTNAQFAVLRREIEARGGLIANAGVGGRLESLPRVAFDSLFSAVPTEGACATG